MKTQNNQLDKRRQFFIKLMSSARLRMAGRGHGGARTELIRTGTDGPPRQRPVQIRSATQFLNDPGPNKFENLPSTREKGAVKRPVEPV